MSTETLTGSESKIDILVRHEREVARLQETFAAARALGRYPRSSGSPSSTQVAHSPFTSGRAMPGALDDLISYLTISLSTNDEERLVPRADPQKVSTAEMAKISRRRVIESDDLASWYAAMLDE